jgi:hypothetical protein
VSSLILSSGGKPVFGNNDVFGDELHVAVKGRGGNPLLAILTVSNIARLLREFSGQALTEASADAAARAAVNAIGDCKQGETRSCDIVGRKSTFRVGDESYHAIAAQAAGVTPALLGKCQFKTPGGKPLDQRSNATEDFVVTVRGLGGADVSRTERILSKLADRAGVAATSRGWILSYLDPFHDHQFASTGVPDNMTANSVPEPYKQSFTITSNQGSTANWDCNIVMFPDMRNQSLSFFNTPNSTSSTSGSAFMSTTSVVNSADGGGVVAYQAVSGNNLPMTANNNGVSAFPITQMVSGSARVYGYGMEVINGTSPLNVQGTCTVWRQPMPDVRTASNWTVVDTFHTANTVYSGAYSGLVSPAPPNSQAEAMLLGGSRQWHAKEGAMVLNTLNSSENPPLNFQAVQPIYYADDPRDSQVVSTTPGFSTTTNGTASANTISGFTSFVAPFNMAGAYFTGLSASTTLTVNLRVYVEFFPSQQGNVLTALAQPSAPYDEQAFRLVAEVMKFMPSGVMLRENGFGDWLKDVAGKVAEFVSPIARTIGSIASAIPHPAAQAIARGAMAAEGIANGVRGNIAQESPMAGDGVAQEIARERRVARARVLPTALPNPGFPRAPVLKSRSRAQAAMDKIAARGRAKRLG